MQNSLTPSETAVYSMRWLILASFCTVTLLAHFASESFAVANQIYAAYYGVNLALLDWSYMAMYVGAVISSPVFAWLFFKQSAGFRILSIVGATCLLATYLVIILSIQFPSLYLLMIISNLLQGVAYTVSFTIGPSFAVLWFPDHQVGLAIAIDLISHNVGIMMGAILPSVVLKYPPSSTNLSEYEDIHHQQEIWKSEIKNSLLSLYLPCACVLILLLLFFIAFMTDLPLKPPTHALLVRRIMHEKLQVNVRGFSQFVAEVKKLYTDANFVLCTVSLQIAFNLIIIFHLHITDLIEHLDVHTIGISLSSDIIGGLLIGTFSLSNVVFGIPSAKLSNKWKNYSIQSQVGLIFTFFVLAGMTLAFYYRSFAMFFVGMILYSIASRIFVIPLFEVITRHTYPIDETFVSVWVGAVGSLILVVIGEIARILSLYTAPISSLILACACAFTSFVLSLTISPTDKRREVDLAHERSMNTSSEETSPLLSDD